MLKKSRDNLPFNIVFVSVDESNIEEAIGHSRLTRVQGNDKACFVESGNLFVLMYRRIARIRHTIFGQNWGVRLICKLDLKQFFFTKIFQCFFILKFNLN